MNEKITMQGPITELLRAADADETHQSELMSALGSTLLESATLKYLSGCSAEDVARFEAFMSEHDTDDALLEELLETFPDFADVLQEEVAALEQDAADIAR